MITNIEELLDRKWNKARLSEAVDCILQAGFDFMDIHVEELLPVAVEIDFGPLKDEDYATLHLFPKDSVLETQEKYQQFLETLEAANWEQLEKEVEAFYICVEQEEEEKLGFEGFGITLEQYQKLSHRTADWVEVPGGLQISL